MMVAVLDDVQKRRWKDMQTNTERKTDANGMSVTQTERVRQEVNGLL